MNDRAKHIEPRHEALRIGGEKVHGERHFEVRSPYSGAVVATVPKASLTQVRRAFEIAHAYKPTLSRYQRSAILKRAGALLAQRREAAASRR